jgi:serine/threonine protein kinase
MSSTPTGSTGERTHRNSLQPGYVLHWYRIDRVLGQGGFGITYEAHDTNLDQPVAIKEYLPMEMAVREGDYSVHPATMEMSGRFRWGLDRFLTEARTLARFRHPSIVRVVSVFEANNTAYMVMDLEHGETLHNRLAGKRTLPEAELRQWLFPLLDGLEAVHAAGFIHRDIKPANIILRSNGTPVLIDFGSARQALGQETRTLTSIISPGYAPYEQYLSQSDRQGPWTDIYSLAATLYRCVTGRAPLEALDRSEGLLKSERDLYVPAVEAAAGQYSRAFLRAIDLGMRFKAPDRPQSIGDWRREFERAELEPVTAVAAAAVNAAPAAGMITTLARAAEAVAIVPSSSVAAESVASTSVAPVRSRWSATTVSLVLTTVAIGVLLVAAAYSLMQRNASEDAAKPGQAAQLGVPAPAMLPQTEVREVTASRPETLAPLEPPPTPAPPATAAPAAQAAPPSTTVNATAVVSEVPNTQQVTTPPAQSDVASLLQQADAAAYAALREGSDPSGAVALYRQVLQIDADNASARGGLTSVANMLAQRSVEALKAGQQGSAETLLGKAEELDREAPLVSVARKQLAQAQMSANVLSMAPASRAPTEPSPMPTAPATPTPSTAVDVEALLALADADLKANRLSSPKNANALERYQDVLKHEPNNTRALAGVDAVAQRYAELARSQLAERNLERARSYLERGSRINPRLDDWAELRTAIDSARSEQERVAATDEKPEADKPTSPVAPPASAAAAPPATPAAVAAPAAAETTPVTVALASPTVAISTTGFDHDLERFGLSGSKLRLEVTQRLQGAGYQVADGAAGLTLALRFKHTYNTFNGIYSYSATVSAQGSGTNGRPVRWVQVEEGNAQSADLRKVPGVFLKHVDAFVASHPAR